MYEEKYQLYMYLKRKNVTNESPYSIKMKYILLTHFLEEHTFGIQLSHVDPKVATLLYSYFPMKVNNIFSHHILHLCHHQRNFHQKVSELLLETQI